MESSEATNSVEKKWPRGRLARRAACVGSRILQRKKRVCSGLSRSDQKNEKAARQLDGLLFQGRIVPTEFRKDHQNFLAKSYWAAKGSVKEFFDNKCLSFQQLNNVINMDLQMTKNVIPPVLLPVTGPFSGTYSSLQIQTDDLDRLWPAEKPVWEQAIGQNPDAAKNEAKHQRGQHHNHA